MTIRSKISIYVSSIFSLLFGMVCIVIFLLFADFRKEEFKDRLSEKASTSIRLLIEVKELDNNLLKIIDRNTIHELYNEKTLIFDDNYNLIYSSLDDIRIEWTKDDLNYLRKHQSFFKKEGDNEIYGFYYDSNKKDYFALISANDKYGNRKLDFLAYVLVFSFIAFVLGTWFCTFYIIKKQLNPLHLFQQKIKIINENNLESSLEVNARHKTEIDLLANEFNYLMNRINMAYQRQKEFTAQASHEFRTPLSRISMQLENRIQHSPENEKQFLKSLFNDITQLKQLINSLLLLSKVEVKGQEQLQKIRIDEIIYNSIENVSKYYPDFNAEFEIAPTEHLEELFEVKANPNLLEIAFENLLKNACQYSLNQVARIEIYEKDQHLVIQISNDGPLLSSTEQSNLFQAFMRGINARNKNGLGLGLRIVHRILTQFHFQIVYRTDNEMNNFLITI